MKAGNIRNRVMAMVIALCMVTETAGCTVGWDADPSASENNIAPGQNTSGKIDDNGQAIRDFDEFVNAEWNRTQAEKGRDVVYAWDDMEEEFTGYLYNRLANTNPQTLPPEEGLYKVVTFYDQLFDNTDAEMRLETMKAYLMQIENVRTLDDLYDLYRDESYAVTNDILRYRVVIDDGSNVNLYWDPHEPWAKNGRPSETAGGKLFYGILEDLGYSEARAKSIAENAMTVADKITECRQKMDASNQLYCMRRNRFEQEGVMVPVIDILGDQYAAFCPKGFNPNLDGIFATSDCFELLRELYRPENVEMLKDFYIASAIRYLGPVADMERYESICGEQADQNLTDTVMSWAQDLLVHEYYDIYIKSMTIVQCNTILDEIKGSARSVIDDTNWLSVHGKEQARSKILRMREFYGGDTAVNDFAEVQLTDNTVENYVSFMVNNDHFIKSMTAGKGEYREVFFIDDFSINAMYCPEYNAVIYNTGWLKYYQDAGCASEEENLAFAGYTMAHEIAHAYDCKGIDYTSKGERSPWMSDTESAIYRGKMQMIINFFDGREVGYGRKIDGNLIVNETFADLMAIECCMRILATKENPDYDAFFRTYAKVCAQYYSEKGMREAVEDVHLPAKERINLILGQFDEFYETYNIDEESPYYVKPDDRLRLF